jgi:peptide/nickel transport system permease protein
VWHRLAAAIPALALIHLLGFGYALMAMRVHEQRSPFGFPGEGSLAVEVRAHIDDVLRGDFGDLPRGQGAVSDVTVAALGRSMLVLGPAFAVSAFVGLCLGATAARQNPTRLAGWLFPAAVLMQSLPSFYIGALLTAGLLALEWADVSVQGNWIWPALVLALRPTVQVAQFVAGLILAESDKQYVITARGVGHSFGSVRRVHVFPNIAASVVGCLAAAFRLSVAELVVVEWLFDWPGIGRLMGMALIVPRRTDALAPFFLHPELTALVFTALAFLFIVVDVIARALRHIVDPRLRTPLESAAEKGGLST